ncbi:MAG: HAMP domain-containing sensor histidine kinase, partial [Pseudomonadota bacterium]
LINNILDIASIEAGYMKLDIVEFDIYETLQSVISLVQERIREHNLHFTLACDPQIGSIFADETRVKQILFNLLSNAIKYSTSGGNIILTANSENTANGEEIVFMVEDNGIGITQDEKEAVFNKFYKTGNNKGSRKSGAGLGLSIVKSFVDLHGGRVDLFSTPGEVTKVSCYLPRRHPYIL